MFELFEPVLVPHTQKWFLNRKAKKTEQKTLLSHFIEKSESAKFTYYVLSVFKEKDMGPFGTITILNRHV